MKETLKDRLRRLIGSPRSSPVTPQQQPPIVVNPEDTPAVHHGAGTQPEDGTCGVGDAYIKMESSRCDLHPLYRLRQTAIELLPPHDRAEIKALRCTRAACRQHYCTDSGYFQFVAGGPPDFGEMKAKQKCDRNHELRYMVVTKLDGGFFWACPEQGCTDTVLYIEPEQR